MTESAARRELLSPRLLPILYLGAAHLFLAAAMAALALGPEALYGFYYQPRLVAVVHLVTLGWVTSSILGATYLVLPMALRTPLPASVSDYAAWAGAMVGIVGMTAHFWIDAYSGMLWSAGLVGAAVAWVAARVLRALWRWRARAPRGAALHVGLAYLNLLLVATLGILAGLVKLGAVDLGLHVLALVHAHAHLAAIGWALMMVMGAGYRLLPMILPATPPEGPTVHAGAALLEVGVLALTVTLMTQRASGGSSGSSGSVAILAAAAVVVAGIGVFLGHVVWMLRRPKPAPPALRRPDPGAVHALQALLYLAASCAVGILLLLTPDPAQRLRWVLVYGALGLVGFLAQMVIGVEMRLVPMFAWMQGYVASDFREAPPSPHGMAWRGLQLASVALWTLAVPALAVGLWGPTMPLVRAAAAALLLAVALGTINLARVARHAFPARVRPG